MDDEGVLDPWVAEWLAANPYISAPMEELVPEVLEMGRSTVGAPPTREIASVTDEVVEGIPVRIYRNEEPPTGLVVYFHGGGFVIGSIGLMDNVARELAHGSGAVVVSVEYRLAPEHPYPAALDDCETVTRWAFANADRFGVPPSALAIAGESAGGNLSAALALRLRESGDIALSAQLLIYPAVSGSRDGFSSRQLFDGIVLAKATTALYWSAYCGGKDLSDDQFAAPLSAKSLEGLPPALVILGGCDVLRDEGRAYANRLAEDGVDVEEVAYPGQPHGFMNLPFPAAGPAFERAGSWLRSRLEASRLPESH
jgi:acetyl esterase